MRLNQFFVSLASIILFGIIQISCPQTTKNKIVYINSYHHGHPSSDEIMEAVIEYFPEDSYEMYGYYMDTKRNPSINYIEKTAAELYDSIIKISPVLPF